jgi:hypothetical protein
LGKEGKAMRGPFPLTAEQVGLQVQSTSPGFYVHSKDSSGNAGHYVGRSDTNVAERLLQWVGSKYVRFWFDYAGSAKAAFEGECTWFHALGGTATLENQQHPGRPENTNWKCPKCGVFE